MMNDETYPSEDSGRSSLRWALNSLLNGFLEELNGLLGQWLPVTVPEPGGNPSTTPFTDWVEDDTC